MINLLSSATSLPAPRFTTAEIVTALRHKLSPELVNTINSLGVDQRYSALENYPDFLSGGPMRPTTSTTDLGTKAAKECIERWGGDPHEIGLLVAATNSPSQLLPCLASEMMADLHGILSRSISTVSMQAQGCSVLLKSVEVAQWYLSANPDKAALVVLSEAQTPYITPLLSEEYLGYREIIRRRKNRVADETEIANLRRNTTLVIQAMLFGDGAVALLLGRGDRGVRFGPITHLTNDDPEDRNLLSMDGGSLHPCFDGRPQYFMQSTVPNRGAYYAVKTVNKILEHPASAVSSLGQVGGWLIHTGSKKILDVVCSRLDLSPDSPKVHTSYEILRKYGNLSSASTGFMLTEKSTRQGFAMVVGFGVGFTASAGVIQC
jgi:3-oxoacyl-[acyl-carrier-protein] synthase III